MEELAVLAEIEYSELFTGLTATAYEPGIWRYRLYATGEILPFMDDTCNRIPINVNNIIIDQVEYTKFNSIVDMKRGLALEKGGWVNGGSVVYIRFPHYRPPYVFFSKKYGVLMGFTNGKPERVNGMMYRPGLLSAPTLSQGADVFTYDRMKFNSATVSIENTKGQFDGFGDLFGNEFNLSIDIVTEEENQPDNLIRLIEDTSEERLVTMGNKETPEEYVVLSDKAKADAEDDAEPFSRIKKIAQYYIASMVVKLGSVDFLLKDKRERLSAKIPDKQFTQNEFPKIDDNLVDKDMQEAYGRCFGVPCACLQGKQIED